MSFRGKLKSEPEHVDLFAALRELERSAKGKPRIGDSAVRAEDVVDLGQDPFLEFPASNISAYEETERGAPKLFSRFLGFFGPQGALPLNTTVEAFHWSSARDPSFARFTDIFSNRFLQLFFRAWADARPIAQHDRPDQDRFFRYVASFAGIGADSLSERDSLADISKLPFAGLVSSRIKSASRLRQLVCGVLHVDADVEERIGSWLVFEPADRLKLGQEGGVLGVDTILGNRVYSINDKICVVIRAGDLEQYRKFLPNGSMSDKLTDLVFFYIGHRFEFDVKLSLPARSAPAARLGVSGELGWTAWIAPDNDVGDDIRFDDARFNALERRRARQTGSRANTH
ncbi:MAG: type VI secretion system baseplate subunit TssG [Pseudaminobacter sp.]|nr:type VI secretion system baseplate subunit TssG [Pseudaminobacter sp.]